jgi:hypothetical protein
MTLIFAKPPGRRRYAAFIGGELQAEKQFCLVGKAMHHAAALGGFSRRRAKEHDETGFAALASTRPDRSI